MVDGHLVSPDGMGGVYNLIGYVLNEPGITTIGIYTMADRVKDELIEQHPWLTEIHVPDGLQGAEACAAWLAPVIEQYGEQHAVASMGAAA